MENIMTLSGSVGLKGNNIRQDVILVQEALNRTIQVPFGLLAVDGLVGVITNSSIRRFQKEVLEFKDPDSRIDKDGKSWSRLRQYLIEAPKTSKGNFKVFQTQSNASSYPLLSDRKIAWGAKVSSAFKHKVIQISKDLGISPDYLMSCMAFETGESFRSDIKNAAGSGATGLIQFMPLTAKGLNTTTEKLAKMSPIVQLDYVKAYFRPYRNRLKKLEDVYLAILYPAAIGKPINQTLFKEGRKTYSQNKGFDRNTDGKITLKEISYKVRQKYDKGISAGFLG